MGQIRKGARAEICCIKNNCWWFVDVHTQLIAGPRTGWIGMDVLKHHCVILKLKKYKWFQYRWIFLGMYVAAGGKTQTLKNDEFYKIDRLNT